MSFCLQVHSAEAASDVFGVSAAACREILTVLGVAASPVEHARACCACALLRASATVARSRVHLWRARDALLRDALSLSTGFGGGAAGGGRPGAGRPGEAQPGAPQSGGAQPGGAQPVRFTLQWAHH